MTKLERLRYEQAQHELRVRELEMQIKNEEENSATIQLNVRITKKTCETLTRLAKNNGVKKSEIVRQALAAYL